MDPNATLDSIKESLKHYKGGVYCPNDAEFLLDDLAGDVAALLNWMRDGGFPPNWSDDDER